METTNKFEELDQLENLVSQFDYLLNEGVIMSAKDQERFEQLIGQLGQIKYSFYLNSPITSPLGKLKLT